jgi:hypothetical protein
LLLPLPPDAGEHGLAVAVGVSRVVLVVDVAAVGLARGDLHSLERSSVLAHDRHAKLDRGLELEVLHEFADLLDARAGVLLRVGFRGGHQVLLSDKLRRIDGKAVRPPSPATACAAPSRTRMSAPGKGSPVSRSVTTPTIAPGFRDSRRGLFSVRRGGGRELLGHGARRRGRSRSGCSNRAPGRRSGGSERCRRSGSAIPSPIPKLRMRESTRAIARDFAFMTVTP